MGRTRKSKQDEVEEDQNQTQCFETPKTHNGGGNLIRNLIAKFKTIKIKVKHLEVFYNKFDDKDLIPLAEIEVRLPIFDEIKSQWDKFTDELSQIQGMSYCENFAEECEEFSCEWYSLYAKFKELSKKSERKDEKPNPYFTRMTDHSVPFLSKLPEAKIATFDGNKMHWLEFKETFKTIIHENPNIPDIIKLTYLLDKLKGKAKESLGFISYTSEGYKKAWELLCDEYDDKLSIIDVHIKGILDLPSVSKDNAQELTDLLNLVNSHVSSLSSIDYKIDKLSEMLLINIVLSKLNGNLRMEWEKEIVNNSIPKWTELIDFLKKQSRILQRVSSDVKKTPSVNPSNKNSKNNSGQKSKTASRQTSSTFHSNNSAQNSSTNSKSVDDDDPPFSCPICVNLNHWLHMCPKFLQLDTHKRFEKTKEFNLCINCLKSKDHGSKKCPKRTCKICKNKHHTLLHHVDNKSTTTDPSSSGDSNSAVEPVQSTSQNFYSKSKIATKQIILSTAIVLVRNSHGKYTEGRALLDNASTSNYVTDSFASKLQLNRCQNLSSSVGLNNTKTNITEKLSTHVKSRTSSFEVELEFHIVPTISDSLPQTSFNISLWDIPKDISLADPCFNMSRPVDLLIGGEIFFDFIQSGKIILKENQPHLQQSLFGWVCVGALKEVNNVNFCISDKPQQNNNNSLTQSLKQLFDIDQIPDQKFLSQDEQFCESHFAETTKRDSDGRYIVSLPLKQNHTKLGESKQQALRRFLNLERKLDLDPVFKEEYTNVINDYLKQGHMKPINDDVSDINSYYLPHHAVVKPSSTTTKVRVVFDASAKTTSNLSLNDVMFVGPTIQQSSFEILLRFRKHRYVFTGDINKMYRQVQIEPCQTPLQRILWRNNKNEPIQSFELLTVTFGTAAAPYLATRALKQLALDESEEFPLTSEIVLKDFYVDDVLSGSDSLSKTIEMQQQLKTLLSHGCFKLHKWSANNDQILDNIPFADREILQPDESSSDECLKTLGLIWLPKSDVFKFRVPSIDESTIITKRSILSDIARLYDPLGLLAPAIIISKMFLQSLWKCQLDWDDPIPSDLSEKWNSFRTELSNLKDLKLDRRIIIDDPTIIQLHGFADASEKGYGACLYIRSFDKDQNCTTRLVCSKTRVAPIKTISLPRLELCAALLLSRLVKTVINSIDITFDNVYLWSDSTITLAWINTPPYKLKTFVANRVNEIQECTVNYVWNHVESAQNSADVITRGVMPSELQNLDTWWNGPSFLNSSAIHFEPKNVNFSIDDPLDTKYEVKAEHIAMATTSIEKPHDDFDLIERYSSYTKLLNVTAFCLRFRYNSRTRNRSNPRIGALTIDEKKDALKSIVKVVQRKFFNTEINLLKKEQPLPRNSSLLSLNPFLDTDGLLRVGGRLSNSNLEYDAKHQLLLPSNNHFTTIVARYYHLKYMHAGPTLLLSLIRQKFWPTSAKNLTRKIVRSCVTCFKVKPQVMSQIMGDLPSDRVNPTRPFRKTGVDLCGPFLTKNKNQRNASPHKVYVAVFVCLYTKAIHLELLSDLSTDCFLACFKRFAFRRGKPFKVWSDNATNFVGARKELKKWYDMFQEEQFKPIKDYCRSEEIIWSFIPPRAPNFGGLWESAVKSMKFHLKRIASNVCLTYEELDTLVIEIEGILNSRPISPLSTDPSDPTPLTPGHFLIGRPIVAPAEPSYEGIPENRLSNWQRISQMTQHFWKRFSLEYIHSLQERVKWKTKMPDLKINDLVLVSDEKMPSTQWMIGLVIELYEGKDNHSRVAMVKTKAGNFKRSISKLSKLPIEQ